MKALRVIIQGLRERSSSLVVGLALATVSAATGFVSYTHICALTLAGHQSWKTAHLMPLAVDGQIVIGSVYLMENEGRRRWLGLIGIVPGVLESLYANWESAAGFGLHSAGWATVPAQAFACSTVLFERWLKARRARSASAKSDADLLADALAEIEGLRASVDAAFAMADAALAIPVPAAAAPAPPAPAAAPGPRAGGGPYPPAPVMGPALPLAARPKAPPAAKAAPSRALSAVADPAKPLAIPEAASADGRPPLPRGAALRKVLDEMSAREIAVTYNVARWTANRLKNERPPWLLEEAGRRVA